MTQETKQEVISQATGQDLDLSNDAISKGQATKDRVNKTLFQEFRTSIKVTNDDSLTLNNDKNLSGKGKQVKAVSVIIDSIKAKETLKKQGLDFDKVLEKVNKTQDPEVKAYAKQKLSNVFRRMGKAVMLSQD